MTALWAEGCGGGFAIGHACGVRVHKVQRVQRVVVAADAADKKRGLMRYGNCISSSITPGTRKQEASRRSPVK